MPSFLTDKEEADLTLLYRLRNHFQKGHISTLSLEFYKRIQELEMKKWNL